MKIVGMLFSAAVALAQVSKVHIAIAGDDGMAVSWTTPDQAGTTVTFGRSADQLTNSADGESRTYLQDFGFHHHTVLKPLDPSTTYYYQIEGDSTVHSFKTVPDSKQRNLKFNVWGDLGSSGNGNGDSTIAYLGANHDDIDLWWHAGDVSYADDSFLHFGCELKFCYEQVWNDYMDEMMVAGSPSIPWMTCPGNHEVECHDPYCLANADYRSALRNFTAYNARFRMPSPESGGVMNMWHSFNAGPVHFLSLDLETGYPGAAEEKIYVLPCGGFGDQLTWLEEDLKAAAANRAERPWIFVSGHHPMYQGNSKNSKMQVAMEKLFLTYGVDMMFTGHVHSYERDYPVYDGQVEMQGYVNPTAPVHIMIGGAGNDEMDGDKQLKDASLYAMDPSRRVIEESNKALYDEVEGAGWTAQVDRGYFGIGTVTIFNDTDLHFEYIRTTTGQVFDEIYLHKDHKVLNVAATE